MCIETKIIICQTGYKKLQNGVLFTSIKKICKKYIGRYLRYNASHTFEYLNCSRYIYSIQFIVYHKSFFITILCK